MGDWFDETIGLYPASTWNGHPGTERFAEYGALLKWRGEPTAEDLVSRVFPQAWFTQMQRYVSALLANQPTDPGERVYWSLVLMGAVSQGMWAFNANDLCWGLLRYGYPSSVALTDFTAPPRTAYQEEDQKRRGYQWLDLPRKLPAVVNKRSFPQIVQLSGLSGREYALPNAAQGGAPFLRLPLIGYDHFFENYMWGGYRERSSLRASWWESWIAEPTARHVPWFSQGNYLFGLTPSVGARWSQEGRNRGWLKSKLLEDTRASAWWKAQWDVGPLRPRTQMYLNFWSLFAFTGRYNNVCPSQWSFPHSSGNDCDGAIRRDQNDSFWDQAGQLIDAVTGDTPTYADSFHWRGAIDDRGVGFFGTLPELVAAAERPNQDGDSHAKAFADGEYEEWGQWFSGLDFAANLNAPMYAYQNLMSLGYVQCWPGYASKQTNYDFYLSITNFLPKHDYDELQDAGDWDYWGTVLSRMALAVQFIASVYTADAPGIVQSFADTLGEIQRANERLGSIKPWDTVAKMPQAFLRSFTYSADADVVCSFNVGSGTSESVYSRLYGSLADAKAALDAAAEPLLNASAQIARRSSFVAPTKRGPKATMTPTLPIVLGRRRGTDWTKATTWAAWALVAGLGGYVAWQATPAPYRERLTRKVPARMRKGAAYGTPLIARSKAAAQRARSVVAKRGARALKRSRDIVETQRSALVRKVRR